LSNIALRASREAISKTKAQINPKHSLFQEVEKRGEMEIGAKVIA